MTARLAHAYGVFHALLGCVVLVAVGLALGHQTLGVTRQPLPLVWPLAVLHVTLAQIPLREILGPIERVAVRGRLTRGTRALLAVLLLTTGSLTYVSADGSPAFQVFFLTTAAVGFVAAAVSRSDPWPWTLGVGMTGVGLQFVTPWAPISRFLGDVPSPAAAAFVALTACFYLLGDGSYRHVPARGTVHDQGARSRS